MQSLLKTTFLFIAIATFWSCNTKTTATESEVEKRTSIEMVTDYGTMVIELYNETPLHRDNFVKLANDGAFDSLLFHRVIEKFMIQGGDPDSKNALPEDTLGNGGLSYKVDAEFNSKLFHKKGALGAARDGNLQRASSSMQFYIVQGKVFNDSLLTVAETRINGWLATRYFKNDTANRSLTDALQKAEDDENWEQYTLLNDSISSLAKQYDNFERYTIPEEQRAVYKSIGGTPHLDQNYTVFGEVVKGLAVVDSIAAVQTGVYDRPLTDTRIRTVRVLE
ncbi:MAG: peptidylprolyl isomerase [Reichenbachiella sp.]|uniref:peptidylprolyl isomerase n=1 Tax=Reichenbachiella sp. TaxID=2184521 RepID=UPI003263CF50